MTKSQQEFVSKLFSLVLGLELVDNHEGSLVKRPPAGDHKLSRQQERGALKRRKIAFVLAPLLLCVVVAIAGIVVIGPYPVVIKIGAGLFLWRTAVACRKFLIK